ncbi:MAG: aldehyde ferredoxin oxidoreductase C-terminal domain-containing protein, partial [Actinobacteria bacterium]|nr:aldehyde ferredoxin oxidoreductase C-terminal domain-containing protein [Actinomycetota bacterium]
IANLRQLFTVREGLNPYDFSLPKAAQGIPPLKEGPVKKVTIDIETMKKEFYDEMEWNTETGMPAESKLKELDLV